MTLTERIRIIMQLFTVAAYALLWSLRRHPGYMRFSPLARKLLGICQFCLRRHFRTPSRDLACNERVFYSRMGLVMQYIAKSKMRFSRTDGAGQPPRYVTICMSTTHVYRPHLQTDSSATNILPRLRACDCNCDDRARQNLFQPLRRRHMACFQKHWVAERDAGDDALHSVWLFA